MGNTYPNHTGKYYHRNHTLYHIGTLDPLGLIGGTFHQHEIDQPQGAYLEGHGDLISRLIRGITGVTIWVIPKPEKYVK